MGDSCGLEQGVWGAAQDLVFVVRQIPDDHFQREGDDLIAHVRVRLEDALSEGKVDVPHLDGRILRVPLKEARMYPARHLVSCCVERMLR